MAISKISDLNSLFNTIFEGAVFVAREQNLMSSLVTNFAATTMANRQMGIYPTVTATVVGEGIDFVNPTTWTKTNTMTLTPQTIQTQVLLTDERIMTDPDDARRDAALEMGGAIATRIDTDLIGEFANLDAAKGSAGSSLTVSIVAAAISVLRASNVPNPLWVVLHPYQWFDIWSELGQPAVNQAFLGDTANEALRNYGVGSFVGANWLTSSNISIDASDDARGAVFNQEALALDTRTAMTMEVERNAGRRAWEINIIARYADGVRRGSYGLGILSDATEPTS